MSNSKRVTRQLFALPISAAAAAAILWPVSFAAATATGWLGAPAATFTDFWMGATTVVTFLGAVAATIGFACTALDSVWTWTRD